MITTKVNNESLQRLMQLVDQKIDAMLIKFERQQEEINELRDKNKQLKDQYAQTLEQIEQYIAELEQIKKTLCR
jgi:chromosome segregation ATPase